MTALFVFLLACDAPVATAPTPAPTPASVALVAPEAHWVERTDLELDTVISTTCRQAVDDGKPVLLEFSAPWCVDCRQLEAIEHHPALAAEYANWHRIRVDVGRFDRHKPLMAAFGVHAIARWIAVRPTSCTTPAPEWPRLREGTLELATGQAGPRRPEEVARWLVEARTPD